MTPRPRETSDAEILAAAASVMQRVSPVDLTLADVAKEAGVHPATLIQRFGTKRELLLANCKAWTADVAGQFARARAKHGSPLKTLIELLVESSAFAATPESMANFLAYLQIDLTDPEFHAVLLTQFATTRNQTEKLLDDAILPEGSAERLDSPLPRKLARTLSTRTSAQISGLTLAFAVSIGGRATRAPISQAPALFDG
jgi:AcrR family transcriptional regulator